MSIAQRSVAGEGEPHLDDSAALTAFRCDSTNLPWIIFRAAFRAAHIEEISPRARAVLSALARTVDATKPFAAIFARRELLTGRALQSMRTFYRSLDDLEVAGLIDRRPQSRYVEAGLFGRAYLHLTAHAAALLGLLESASAVAPAQNVEPATESVISSTRASSPVPPAETLSAFHHPSATLADGGIYKDLSPVDFQKRQPGHVPEDLQRLRTLGFFDFLIFKLMREAREHGKRLSDVVEATWDHLKLAKAPINYLRALLRNSVDFSLLVRRRLDTHAAERIRAEHQAEAARVAHEHAGETFIDADGQRQYSIGADGESMTIVSVEEGVGRQATGWMQAFAQALASGKIRPATAFDREAFAAARCRVIKAAQADEGRARAAQVEVSVSNGQRPPVTNEVRAHIAGLRRLLQPRVVVA